LSENPAERRAMTPQRRGQYRQRCAEVTRKSRNA
jgi:hypothetical protein